MAFAGSRTDFAPHWRRAVRSPLFLAVAGLWVLLLAAEWVRPCFFLHDDNATWFCGAYAHDFRVLTETWRVAEVNFNQYGGEPFLEQGQTAVLYPPVYVGVALATWISGDMRWTIEWLAAMHLTLGLLGFYFWLRQGGVNPALAALGGLAWVLNPFVLIVAASWITVTFAAAWLPWLFWALDRLYRRPTPLSAFLLGVIAALFFLQGYVQWVAYSLMAIAFYGLLRFIARGEMRRVAIALYLAVAGLIFLALTLPLLLPMLHAIDFSAARAKPISLERALEYRVMRSDLFAAQFFHFRPHLIFGLSTAILCCPAFLFFPVAILGFFRSRAEIRQRLFPLLLLALLALLFSSRWHFFLMLIPVMAKFRWPFKVFLLVDFFMLASLVWGLAVWATDSKGSSRRAFIPACVCLSFVVIAGLSVALAGHDDNFFSKTTLPSSDKPLPSAVDPRLGRVISVGESLRDSSNNQFLTHAYATYYEIPSIGGYDPLVSRDLLRYAPGLDYPNLLQGAITPEVRKFYEARGVRYWIVDLRTANEQGFGGMTPFGRVLGTNAERLLLEDEEAAPLVYSDADPHQPVAMIYAGNSILVSLTKAASPLEISVGPTDGWWYRIDDGPWLRAVYRDDRLKIDFTGSPRMLEVSYFDARFRSGLKLSGCIMLVLVLLFVGRCFLLEKRPA